ncbi:MAG TPA: RidA family protein [Caulobacter sp.]|nr:RidA family protein [Caulobacter sp.]
MSRTAAIILALAGFTAAFVVAAAPVVAQEAPKAPPKPTVIPAPGGSVIIPTPRHQQSYDTYRYAPARRVGDTLYVSGVILFRGQGEGNDLAAFEAQARRAYKHLDVVLKAAGASFDDVVMVNSFHVWEGPNFTGTRDQQIEIMNKVRAEFTSAPHPAWTAVGTTGLLAPTGIVEIQLIAQLPAGKA